MIPRRGLLAGLGALLAAPAIIRTPGLLMPVRPLREPILIALDFGPPAGDVLMFQRWIAQAARDVEFITGCNAEMLGASSRARTGVTTETQRQQALTKWHVLDSKFRG